MAVGDDLVVFGLNGKRAREERAVNAVELAKYGFAQSVHS